MSHEHAAPRLVRPCVVWHIGTLREGAFSTRLAWLLRAWTDFACCSMAAPGAGGVLVPAAAPPLLSAPATPHTFTRVTVAGADNTLDYWATPSSAKLVHAFPGLGWIDSSSAMVGTRAAPALLVASVTCPAAHGTWGDAISAPIEAMSDLTACFTPAAASRFADTLASLDLLDRHYHHSQDFYEALELLLSAVPSPLPTPSPFQLVAGDVAVRSPFLSGGSPAIPAVAGLPAIAAVPAVIAVPAIAAIPARAASRGLGTP